MSITNRIVLAVSLALASSSAALAQGFDPNLANRIPVLNQPGVYGYPPGGGSGTRLLGQFESAPVALYGRSYGPRIAPGTGYGRGYGLRTAPVGLRTGSYGRAYGHNYGAYQSAPVGLYQGYGGYAGYGGYGGYGGLQSAPVSLYDYVYQTPFDVDRHDRASSPYAGGGF